MLGVEFIKRDENNNVFLRYKDKEIKYQLLNILEFNSDRKRMSAILRNDKGQIELLTKGADSIILERLNKNKSKFVDETNVFIEEYAKEGLRTLLLAKRVIDEREYNSWNNKYIAASQSVKNRDEEIAKVNE